MSKVALSLAEKMAQLRHIPYGQLPSTLKHKILLPKITEIRLEANRSAKEIGPVFAFYRKYIADLRHHNPHLKIVRDVSDLGPLIARITVRKASKGGESKQVKQGEVDEGLVVIEGGKYKSAQELKARIVECNNSE